MLKPISKPGCFLVDNPNLKAETSINKEIGIEYNYAASLTYFHNDYHNKGEAGQDAIYLWNILWVINNKVSPLLYRHRNRQRPHPVALPHHKH